MSTHEMKQSDFAKLQKKAKAKGQRNIINRRALRIPGGQWLKDQMVKQPPIPAAGETKPHYD